ncbi:hypothetical protein LMUR_13489 [Listeria grayi FSL F6-1183]|uniref:Uncharacterized protein n=1 Tax=Listeria grayi FSL F6-1183 TaxID=1265827 RepID=A0A829R2K3_LISGR|nr:hypothetical protein LMUR_13489 [Listeria grayi FSL F6-1183]
MKNQLSKFKQFFIENKFVLALLIFLIVALDILLLTKISFIFKPVGVILKNGRCADHFSGNPVLPIQSSGRLAGKT